MIGGACLVLALMAAGCERETPKVEAEGAKSKLVVYTTFYPTTYFAQRIGGDLIDVVCPCPPDTDPATWMPDDATIAAYQQADLILINGASFEKWPAKVSLPPARVVDTTASFADEFIVLPGAVAHAHGPEGEHTHEGIDGHTWLDPNNALAQSVAIRSALIQRLPDQEKALRENHAALAKDLVDLNMKLTALDSRIYEQMFLASHPAYNYLARRYGWRVTSLYLDPETMPDEDALKEIAALLKEKPSKYILWEAPPDAKIAELLRERFGLTGIVFSPCESLTAADKAEHADYLTLMARNIARLEQALRG